MTRRKDFLALALLPGSNLGEPCRRFGISRQTAYKWLRRYRQEGAGAMADRSRRPKAHPRTTAAGPVAALLALRAEQPTWGPRKLRRRLEDHARYLVALQACAGQRTEIVQAHLERCFRTHGLPASILCDNGSPWSGPGGEHTALSVWLILLGVSVRHGRPFHPQTQGKDERFHRTLKADLLARRDWTSLAQAQPLFDAYRHLYNHERPHQALGDRPPASRYRPSPRAWQAPESDFAYGPAATVRRVKAKGEITFQNRFFYLGHAF